MQFMGHGAILEIQLHRPGQRKCEWRTSAIETIAKVAASRRNSSSSSFQRESQNGSCGIQRQGNSDDILHHLLNEKGSGHASLVLLPSRSRSPPPPPTFSFACGMIFYNPRHPGISVYVLIIYVPASASMALRYRYRYTPAQALR